MKRIALIFAVLGALATPAGAAVQAHHHHRGHRATRPSPYCYNAAEPGCHVQIGPTLPPWKPGTPKPPPLVISHVEVT